MRFRLCFRPRKHRVRRVLRKLCRCYIHVNQWITCTYERFVELIQDRLHAVVLGETEGIEDCLACGPRLCLLGRVDFEQSKTRCFI